MNYKLISSKNMIAKMFRDLKPDNGSFVTDAIEWMGEALEFIGVVTGMEHKFDDLEVRNHRTSMPCDMHYLGVIEYKGRPLPFGSDVRIHALPKDGEALINPVADVAVSAYFRSNTGQGNFNASFSQVTTVDNVREYCVLDPGVIRTSFESGTIRVHYMSIPVDCDNMPMIPDNVETKQAIQWYIIRQMIMGGYRHPIFSYDYADAKWEEYCSRAQNDLMFPSPEKMESFKRLWVTMVPKINDFEEFRHHR